MNALDHKNQFIMKHGKSEWKVHTSPLRQDGSYCKTYAFGDGAVMTEINRPVYEEVSAEATVRGIKVTITETVKLMETEIWHTDDAKSVKSYERW